MSARIVPLSVLTFVLLTIFCAVVATAQVPLPGGAAPVTPGITPEAAVAAGMASVPQPQAPFVLKPEEQAIVDRVLVDWQGMSGKVKTFQCEFTRWDYDGVFGDGKTPNRQVSGELRYAAPDKGFYELKLTEKDDPRLYEKWVCTGDAIFEFKADLKQVREYPLPPEMRGKAISDGPLPFVFGVEAEKMKSRYWLRIITPPERQASQVWIEAYPKHAKDAANVTKVDVILTFEHDNGVIKKLEPYGINLILPNGNNRTAYVFREMQYNTAFDVIQNGLNFYVRPSTPFGWQHQVVDDTVPVGPETPQGAQPAAGIGSVPQTTVPR
jgi:TIGR03009 family protein